VNLDPLIGLAAGTALAPALPYAFLVAGLAALVVCGNWLVSGSVQIARRFGVSSFVVGLTVVAYGTSAPEMFISLGAAARGAHDIALGNVVGSNIANIGAILAIVALVATIPTRDKAIGLDLAAMLALTALLFAFGLTGSVGRPAGALFVAFVVAYTLWSVARAKKKGRADPEPATMRLPAALALTAAALFGLYLGSDVFVEGARGVAASWGVSERVIAVSIVALGTSSPELVASLVAALRKEADLSIGNIIGSNLFNIGGVLGVTAIARPIVVADRALFAGDMAWLLGFSTLLVLAMLPLSKGKISRPEGALLLALYCVYVALLFR